MYFHGNAPDLVVVKVWVQVVVLPGMGRFPKAQGPPKTLSLLHTELPKEQVQGSGLGDSPQTPGPLSP